MSSNRAHGEVYSIQLYVIKIVNYLRRVGGFRRVLQFLHQQIWPPRYNWNIIESGVKHHNPNHVITTVVESTYNRYDIIFRADIQHIAGIFFLTLLFIFIREKYDGWLRPCENFFILFPYNILFPQLIFLFPQEIYFVPTTYYLVPSIYYQRIGSLSWEG